VLLIKRLTTKSQAQLAAHPSALASVERIQDLLPHLHGYAGSVAVESRRTNNQRR
jgi:hypothetical protein